MVRGFFHRRSPDAGHADPAGRGAQRRTRAAADGRNRAARHSNPATAVYQNYLLNAQSQWVDEATGMEVTNLPLLEGFRAFFLLKP